MIDLEIATTEQIIQELAKRPLRFIFVASFHDGQDRDTGMLGHSPELPTDDALYMLHRAEEFFSDPSHEESRDDGTWGD